MDNFEKYANSFKLMLTLTIITVIMLLLSGCNDEAVNPGKITFNDSEDTVTITDNSQPEPEDSFGVSLPVETTLDIPDADGKCAMARPIVFALTIGHEYSIHYSIIRHGWLRDEEGIVHIDLPSSLKLTEGAIHGSGTGIRNDFEAKVVAIATGDSEIVIKAEDARFGLGTSVTFQVKIFDSAIEAKEFVDNLIYRYKHEQEQARAPIVIVTENDTDDNP